MESFRLRASATLLSALSLAAVVLTAGPAAHAQSTSSPIALSPDEALLWVVNPAADSVTIIDTATNEVLDTIPVGDEPRSIAIDPRNRYAFVANAAGNSVTVLRILDETPEDLEVVPDDRIGADGELITGAEAASVVVTPDGRRAFVANAGQDTITVIDVRATGGPQIIGQVDLRLSLCNGADFKRHFQPRGLAVTADSSRLYTARFLSFTPKGGVQGDDEGKVGLVCRLDIDTSASAIDGYVVAGRVKLAPQETGFAFTPPDGFPSTAFPNQLQSVVIRGDKAYLPNIAASPSAPLRFNLDTMAFVNVIDGVDGASPSDAGAINLHLGARVPEAGKKLLFFANPWAIAFTSQSGEGNAYVVSAASDLLVKLDVDADGNLAFTDSDTTTRYIDLDDPGNPLTSGASAGKNPRGIVINQAGTTAYVTNFVSRNVSVVDLTTDLVIATVQSIPLPQPGSQGEIVAVGAEMFFSSRGHFDRPPGTTVSTDERLSAAGWQGCASCHFEGLTDGVVWVFGAGPRKSVPLNASFDPANPDQQRILNYSAIFDEIEDFELNVRNVSGPGPVNGANDPNHGLLFDDDGDINQAPAVINAFALPNEGRNQFTVTLPGSTTAVPALTALKEWVRVAVRTPNGPLDASEIDGGPTPANIARGRELFEQAGCQTCHGGSDWTASIKDFDSPPDPTEVFTETNPPPNFGNPVGAQYLDRFLAEVGSFNAGVAGAGNPIGKEVGAPELATAAPDAQGQLNLPDGLGIDYNGDGAGDGFNIPSLLGAHGTQPYLHNGACETLVCVLESSAHRTAGNLDDVLNTQKKRNKVARFVESIDAETEPFEP